MLETCFNKCFSFFGQQLTICGHSDVANTHFSNTRNHLNQVWVKKRLSASQTHLFNSGMFFKHPDKSQHMICTQLIRYTPVITQAGDTVSTGHVADLCERNTKFINIATVKVNHGGSPFQSREADQFSNLPYRSPNRDYRVRFWRIGD